MNEYEKLTKIIDNCDTISFDIFDTLILRNVFKPTDIFQILDNFVYNKYKIKNFKTLRIEAEEKTRVKENNMETTLDEIYDYIEISTNLKTEIKMKELELEDKFIIANPFMTKIFAYCLKKKKKIICITDMYLPLSFIKKLLDKNDYKNVKIYLSCEFHAHKIDMSLYEKVNDLNKFKKEKWLHIGDNLYSDYNEAIKFGIKAYHYKKVAERLDIKKYKSLTENIINTIINNYLYNGNEYDYWYSFALKYVSLLYLSFSNWANANNQKFNFNNLDDELLNKYFKDKKINDKEFYRFLFKNNKKIVKESALDMMNEIEKYSEYLDKKYFDIGIKYLNEFLKIKNYDDLIMFNKLNTKNFIFVPMFSKEEIKKEKIRTSNSIWKNSFLIKDMKKDEYEEYLNKICKKYNYQFINIFRKIRRKR